MVGFNSYKWCGFFLLAGMASVFHSCINESNSIIEEFTAVDQKEVTISMSVPGTFLSRSLTNIEEEQVQTVDLLVFDLQGNYQYVSRARDIVTDPGQSLQRNFRAVMFEGTVDVTILANARQWLFDCYPSGIPDGTPKAEVQKKLVATIQEKWSADPLDYLPIPMWGEMGTVTIDQYTTSIGDANGIGITRMISKIDVSTDIPTPTDFTLKSVHLYNRNTKGTLIPEQARFDASLPSLVPGSSVTRGPLLYDGAAISNDANGRPACIDEIYTFEALAGSLDTYLSTTCLVVGGEYKGVMGYYRVDFMNYSGITPEYIPLLRNHHYEVVIRDVTEEGKGTPDEAFESFPVGIEVSIVDWHTQSMDDIDIGGNYTLKVSRDEVIISNGGATETLYIFTDFPDGWELDVPANNWLTVSTTSGGPNNRVAVELTAGEYTADQPRMVVMELTVDNVVKRISVIQQGLGNVNLYVIADPTNILFQKRGSAVLNIDTYPANANRYFSYSGNIEWEDDSFLTTATTATSLTLVPKTNFAEKTLTGILTIYIRDQYGNIASDNVYMRQLDYLEGFDYRVEDSYPAAGGTFNFRVHAEEDWRVTDVKINGTATSAWSPNFSGWQLAAGWKDFSFTLGANPDYATRKIEVTIETASGNGDVIEFVQDFVAPYFNVIGGDEVIIPATNSPRTVDIEFETNCNWSATFSINSGYAMSITNIVSGAIQTQNGGNASNVVTGKITVSVSAFSGSAFSYAVGSELPFNITLRSQNVSPHTAVTKTVAVKRIMPVLWEFYTYNASNANNSSRQNPLRFGNPAVSWAYDNGLDPASSTLYMYQCAHTLSILARSNAKWTVYTSLAPNNKVEVTDTGSGYYTAVLNIPENTTGERNVTLTIDCNDGEDIRTMVFKQDYVNPNNIIFKDRNGTTIPTSKVLPTGGLVVTYQFSGAHPDVYAITYLNGQIASVAWDSSTQNPHKLDSGTGGNAYIKVLPNMTMAQRDVAFSLSVRKDGFYITPFRTHKQNYQTTRLNTSPQRYVAKSSLGAFSSPAYARVNWVTALGIEDNWLTQTLTNYYNYTPVLTNSTVSCATYKEDGDGGAVWRVPTLDELNEIYTRRDEIGGFDHYYWNLSGGIDWRYTYWSVTPTGSGADEVFSRNFASGSTYYSYKSTESPGARCVRN